MIRVEHVAVAQIHPARGSYFAKRPSVSPALRTQECSRMTAIVCWGVELETHIKETP